MKGNISKKQLKEFGILMGLIFPTLIGWIIPLLYGHTFKTWTFWIGIPFFILGFLNSKALLIPYKLWMRFGHILGRINSSIILGLVFLIVLQPISLIMKFFNYDPLRKKKNSAISYRENKKGYKVDITRIF